MSQLKIFKPNKNFMNRQVTNIEPFWRQYLSNLDVPGMLRQRLPQLEQMKDDENLMKAFIMGMDLGDDDLLSSSKTIQITYEELFNKLETKFGIKNYQQIFAL